MSHPRSLAPAPDQPGNVNIVSDRRDGHFVNFDLPEIKAGRCVHTLIQNASCQACVDACHVSALRIAEKKPFIDPDICDGCGICAGVCPELAIEQAHRALSIQSREGKIALIACEKISEQSKAQDDGIINCLHALSVRELAELYGTGHRRLLVSSAACEHCHRGSDKRLEKHLNTLNLLLKKSSKPLLERINISPEKYFNIVHSADHSKTGAALNRRRFLRWAASEVGRTSLRRFIFKLPEQCGPVPISRLLSTTSKARALPYVPQISTRHCTACDTCLKLCPHDALVINRKPGSSSYSIHAENCSGCGICVDVCEDSAIVINRNTIASKSLITLNDGQCHACGMHFYSLDPQPNSLCLICQQKTQAIPLFQVLN